MAVYNPAVTQDWSIIIDFTSIILVKFSKHVICWVSIIGSMTNSCIGLNKYHLSHKQIFREICLRYIMYLSILYYLCLVSISIGCSLIAIVITFGTLFMKKWLLMDKNKARVTNFTVCACSMWLENYRGSAKFISHKHS